MYELNDLLVLLRSGQPIICIETHEEQRALSLVQRCQVPLGKRILKWTITGGLVNTGTTTPSLSLQDKEFTGNPQNLSEPQKALVEIKDSSDASVISLLDFHPHLDDPFTVRLLKEIAIGSTSSGHQIIFISSQLTLPQEISKFSTKFSLSLPDATAIRHLVISELKIWKMRNENKKFRADRKSIQLLVNNLLGLSVQDCQRLIRNAIYDDDALSKCDIDKIQKAKYELIGQQGVLSFEFETSSFSQVGGFASLKSWLQVRQQAFLLSGDDAGIDKPKGLLLVGVQGCGKSLAARAVAGAWSIPLLRLDFGMLYNKFFGETEKNMRHAIDLAEVMAPCVLWIDEIEKGISTGDYDSGTSQRLLATLLTWMAENSKAVFIVATANNIDALPPELIRKGRLDEVFFVDLPDETTRKEILSIHLAKRKVEPDTLQLENIVAASKGFSGAEIEQLVVSSYYQASALNQEIDEEILLTETQKTRPLSIVMSEQISSLQQWAKNRTVPAN